LRIKSLQVHGFKSFVDRTVFSFRDGITAVVGPNGCGKSNVVDAVRWVMGEQSARRLRGKAMDDVIFAGSETRPPIGMAEVVLTFDNSDGQAPAAFAAYSEIQIARRIYRSGEAEYRINKTVCRLRDVHDFFRDTGIGVKGYTIVEQGRIAEIVSAKPEERRGLIEEAAGISKYKARRREAESKMSSTEGNLVRVNDVLGEIRRQISSLERQARKAARYKRLQETQRVLELSIAADDRRELQAAVESSTRRLREIQAEAAALEAQVSQRDLALEQRRLALTEMEKAVTRGAERLFGLRSEIKDLESKIELAHRETEGLEASNRGRAEETETLRQQLATAEAEAAQAVSELQRLDDSLTQEKLAIVNAEAEAREAGETLRSLERERERANEGFVEILTGIARAEDRQGHIEERRAAIDQRLRSADRELEFQQTQASEVGREESHLEQGLRALLAERERLQDDLRRAMRRQEEASESLREASEALSALRSRAEARKARLGSLHEVLERREDLGEGTRHVLEQGEEARLRYGHQGLLREVLEVEQEAERAVEAVLADRAEALVVDDPGKALEALAAIRQAGKGRSVFVARPPSDTPASGLVPLGQPLLGSVRPRPGFEGLARALLGDVVLVESLRDAISRYGGGPLPATFVTREGEVLSSDGVIRGPGVSQGAGGLARLREVRELEREVESLEQQVVGAEAAHAAAARANSAAGEELENLRNRHHTGALAVANHEKDLERSRERLKVLGEAQEGRVAERSQLIGEGEGLGAEVASLVSDLERLRALRTERQRELDGIGLKIHAAGREVTRLETRVTELRVAHDGRVDHRNRLEETANRARGSEKETREWIARRERESADATERIAGLAQQVRDCESGLASKLRDEERARALNEEQRASYDAEAVALRELESEARRVSAELGRKREEASAADLQARESALKLQHQDEAVREKWGVELAHWELPALDPQSPEEIAAEAAAAEVARAEEEREGESRREEEEPEVDAASALRDARKNAELARRPREERVIELEKVRKGLQSLGDVNLGAIEEHEELAERFRFLSEQKEDLERTLHSLREAISRINRTSRRRFRETFEAVSKCFSENFPRLFGGGKASLQLTEAEDILEAGIDIMAMPPGKRLQNVNLLSGGEKTMTALALLTAVFQVRPSPFFLLDEVDAALDDANVGRFNQLIKELAQQSQFLVITHNKRTIEVGDTLYGVTMEQKGVSKLVAVELN